MEELVKRYYLENDFNCAEAMMHAANEAYQLNLSEETFHAFSGFGGGCGCGRGCDRRCKNKDSGARDARALGSDDGVYPKV